MNVPVLIIGAGPTGLAASILLSRHGVPSLVVERHPGTSVHPKATGISARTMELFRSWGIDAAVRQRGLRVDPVASVSLTLASPDRAIDTVDALLVNHFPIGDGDDVNELPDSIHVT